MINLSKVTYTIRRILEMLEFIICAENTKIYHLCRECKLNLSHLILSFLHLVYTSLLVLLYCCCCYIPFGLIN